MIGLDPGGLALFWAAILDASGLLGNLRFPPREPNSVRGVSNGIEVEGPVVLGRLGPPPNGGERGAIPWVSPFCGPESGCSGPK